MATPQLRVMFPPLKVIEEQLDTGIAECIFEDKNLFNMLGEFEYFASVNPTLTVAAGPQTFTFPHLPDIKAIWWEYLDQAQSTTDHITMTLVDGTGPTEIRNLRKYFFCFCQDFDSVTLEVAAGDNIPIKMIVLG